MRTYIYIVFVIGWMFYHRNHSFRKTSHRHRATKHHQKHRIIWRTPRDNHGIYDRPLPSWESLEPPQISKPPRELSEFEIMVPEDKKPDIPYMLPRIVTEKEKRDKASGQMELFGEWLRGPSAGPIPGKKYPEDWDIQRLVAEERRTDRMIATKRQEKFDCILFKKRDLTITPEHAAAIEANLRASYADQDT